MSEFDPDTPFSLDEAAAVLLRGLVKASTLRAAAERGELAIERLGRRIIVTPAAIDAWRKASRISSRGQPIKGHSRSETQLACSEETQRAAESCRQTIERMKTEFRHRH